LISYDNAATHGQAVHEAAIVCCVIEPGFVNAPVKMLFTQFLVRQLVAGAASMTMTWRR
jgi:hypothetical protein